MEALLFDVPLDRFQRGPPVIKLPHRILGGGLDYLGASFLGGSAAGVGVFRTIAVGAWLYRDSPRTERRPPVVREGQSAEQRVS